MIQQLTQQARSGGKGIDNGGVERVTQMGSPVVKRAFSGDGGLHSKSKEPNHGETCMLDFSQLKRGLLLRVSSQAQWVEELASRVQPLFRVKFCVPLELDVPDQQNLDPDQCGQ